MSSSVRSTIRERVEATPFIDTHEHLIEESRRVSGDCGNWSFPCDDWAVLLSHYVADDLISAGMSGTDLRRFLSPEIPPEEKYPIVAPWWPRIRHTGYGRALRHTLRGLYDIADITADTVPLLQERYRALVGPGYYEQVIRGRSNVELCQVNSLERIYMETEQPDLLKQDLSIVSLSSGFDPPGIARDSGKTADSLDGWLAIVDHYFATYGPRAVAVKSQSAYQRRLDYADVPRGRAEAVFAKYAANGNGGPAHLALDPDELKDLQDFLLRYAVGKATEYGLPVKLHTGYYAGHNRMPLDRVRRNAGDLCPLLVDFPDARFVLMHVGYPYQDEYVALAKHYANVSIDLCWAWIINPEATSRFVREFLLAAPLTKLFTFGGDFIPVELVYGHSRVAREGLTLALSGLVEDGWMELEETPEVIERLMNGNAREAFPAR